MSFSDITQIKLSNLVPDPDNVNTHNEINISQIKSSISRFGFLDPIGVVEHDTRRGFYTIVEGHGRYEAALLLELFEVPCLVLTMDEAHRRGYAIAHNQTQQISSIDHKAVALEFERLDVGAGDYVSLGYTQEDVLFLPGIGVGTGGSPFHDHTTIEGSNVPRPIDIVEKTNAASGFAPAVHRTSLTFTTDQSYNRFVHVLTALRGRYPTAGTIGERIVLLLGDMGVKAPVGSVA